MPLSTSPRQPTTIRAEARKSLALSIYVVKQDNSPVDLTGAAMRLVVTLPKRNGGGVVITEDAVMVLATSGIMRFDLQAADLDLLEAEHPLAITLVTAEGYSSVIVKGVLDMQANTDPAESVYTDVVPPLGLTVTLRDSNRVTVKVNHHPDSVLLAYTEAAQVAASQAGGYADAAQAAAAGVDVGVAAAAASAVAAAASAVAAESAITGAQAAAVAAEAAADAAELAAAGAGGDAAEAQAAAISATASAAAAAGSATAADGSATDAAASALGSAGSATQSQNYADSALESATAAAAIRTVKHGLVAETARPVAAIVHWVGTATPTNGLATDFITRVNLP